MLGILLFKKQTGLSLSMLAPIGSKMKLRASCADMQGVEAMDACTAYCNPL